MNSTGQNGEKTGYLVIILLVVGLTAFSSAMKELNQLQRFALDATSLIAQWSDKVAPTPIPHTAIKLETCESNRGLKQSAPTVELPWLTQVDEEISIPSIVAPSRLPEVNLKERPATKLRDKSSSLQVARMRRVDIAPMQLELSVSTGHDAEPGSAIVPSELPVFLFKAKTRKHNTIRINPRDREMLLKTLNRSINLRIAS